MLITELIIDPRCLGNKLWLVDITPVYEYKDNKRTDNITAYKYTVTMPEKNFDKIAIKIDGRQLVEKPEGYGLLLSLILQCLYIGSQVNLRLVQEQQV